MVQPTFYGASLAISELLHEGARDALGRYRDQRHYRDFLTTVVMSVTAAHAGINEMWDLFGVSNRRAGRRPEGIRAAWQAVAADLTGAEFDEGNRPWTDFDALVGLRNRIIHFEWGGEPPPFVLYLHGRGLTADGGPWMEAVTTPAVAELAVNVVVDMFEALRDRSHSPVEVRWDGWSGWVRAAPWRDA